MIDTIDYREIDTPWPPQPIVWRKEHCYDRAQDLHRAIRESTTGAIVREVAVYSHIGSRDDQPLTISQVEETLAHTDDEFDLLRLCGIEVAKTDWHIFTDNEGKHRPLARVQIILGNRLKHFDRSEILDLPEDQQRVHRQFYESTTQYVETPKESDRLYDVDIQRQYRYGAPLLDTRPTPNLYLVDIEPIYWIPY